jgi:hypothetical protein
MRLPKQENITARIVLNARCAAMRDAKHAEKAIAGKMTKNCRKMLFAINKNYLLI